MAEDRKMNEFTTVQDAAYIYAEAADGSQVKMLKADLMKLISGFYPQIERLNYGLGGVNHINGNTDEIAANTWVFGVGFSDGDVVTVSLESNAGVTVNLYRDDGYTIGARFTASSSDRITKTITNLGGKNMLIFSQDGPIRKIMVERGYFASEWRQRL